MASEVIANFKGVKAEPYQHLKGCANVNNVMAPAATLCMPIIFASRLPNFSNLN